MVGTFATSQNSSFEICEFYYYFIISLLCEISHPKKKKKSAQYNKPTTKINK
jgi:hypothetical protein